MEAQLQLAKSDVARAKQLIVSNSISQAEFDAAMTRLQTTQANVERANRIVEEAKVYLDFATVVAPFGCNHRRQGRFNLVIPSALARPSCHFMTPSQMQLVANVRESLAMKLQVGQQLPARMESLGYECLATVSEVVPKADVSSRSFRSKLPVPVHRVCIAVFWPLMLPLEDEQLLLIPAETIQRAGQLTFVQVLSGGTLVRDPFRLVAF